MCCTSRTHEVTRPLLRWGGTVLLGILGWALALGFIAFVAVMAKAAFDWSM